MTRHLSPTAAGVAHGDAHALSCGLSSDPRPVGRNLPTPLMPSVPRADSLLVRFLPLLVVVLAAGCDVESVDPPPPAASLSIDPVIQQTEVWCWAATVEMVLRHYGVPNLNEGADYQCGIVAVYALIRYGGGHPCTEDCRACLEPIDGMPEVERLVEEYGHVARGAGLSSPVLRSTSVPRRLTLAELMTDIAADRPVIAAVSTNGGSFPDANDHVVVIVGYDTSVEGTTIIVNDPYPYDRFASPAQNPYVLAGGRAMQSGQYEIGLQDFVDRFGWAGSLYRIQPA